MLTHSAFVGALLQYFISLAKNKVLTYSDGDKPAAINEEVQAVDDIYTLVNCAAVNCRRAR